MFQFSLGNIYQRLARLNSIRLIFNSLVCLGSLSLCFSNSSVFCANLLLCCFCFRLRFSNIFFCCFCLHFFSSLNSGFSHFHASFCIFSFCFSSIYYRSLLIKFSFGCFSIFLGNSYICCCHWFLSYFSRFWSCYS